MNKIIYLSIIILSCNYFVGCMSKLTKSQMEGLIAYYPFNGNAHDQSGHGHDGIVHGAYLTADKFGKPSSAYKFNGIDQYIISDMNELKSSNVWSVSLWVNIDSLNRGGSFVLLTSTPGYNADGFWWHFWTDGKVFYRTHDDSVSMQYINELAVPLQTHVWQHHVIIIKNNQVVHYLNGAKVFTWNPMFNHAHVNSDVLQFIIGAGYNYENWYFIPASIDNIYVYNRELSESEIQVLYNKSE